MSNARHTPMSEASRTPETDAFANEIAPESTLKAICADWYEHACKLEQQRDAALERERGLLSLVKSIQDALGTGEEGDNLIAVARDSHRAEMELSAIEIARREADDLVDCLNGKALAAKGEK